MRMAIAAVIGSLLLLAAPGRAAACSPTDVACAAGGVADTSVVPVDSIVGTASDAVDAVSDAARGAGQADPTGVVDDAVSTATSQVEQVRDAVANAAKKTVDPVVPVVDGIVDTARDTIGTVTPAVSPLRTKASSRGAHDRTGNDDSRRGHESSTGRAPLPRFGYRRSIEPIPSVLGAGASAADESVAAPIALSRRGLLPGLLGSSAAGIAAEVAKRIAFPVALLLIVMGFLFVQHRIDRREPKLASAPAVRDIARFA
jgi:hypothetical protein